MALLTDEDFAAQQKDFDANFRRLTTVRTQEEDDFLQEQDKKTDLYPQIQQDINELKQAEIINSLASKQMLPVPGVEDAELLSYDVTTGKHYIQPEIEEELVGTENINKMWLESSPEYRVQELKSAAHERAKLSSFDFHYTQNVKDSAIDSGYLSAEQANALAKKYNANLTYTKDTSSFAVFQDIETYRRKLALDYYTYQVQNYGSLTALQNLGVLGSALTGGIGPMEGITSVIASIAFPEVTIGTVSRGAGLLRNIVYAKKGYKTMEQAAAITNQAKYANTIAKGAAGMSSDKMNKASGLYTKTVMTAEQKAAEEKSLALLKKLEDLEKLGGKYDALAGGAKAGVDALSLMAIDAPYIAYTYNSARDMGQEDLYTLKDAAADFMLAGTLGVALPAWGRHLFRMTPESYISRQIDNAERNIYEKEALGQISEKEAKDAHNTISKARKALEKTNEVFKKPNPKLVELSEGLRRSNMTDEELRAFIQVTYHSLASGIRPKLHKIPSAGALFSTLHFDVIKQFRRNTATPDTVFGEYLKKVESKNGLHTLTVMGEDGLLGKYKATGLNALEADYYTKEMYKAYILRDKKALRNIKKWAKSFDEFITSLTEVRNKVAKDQKHNADVDNKVINEKKVSIAEQQKIREKFERAWLKYKLSEEEFKAYKEYLDEASVASALGYEKIIPKYLVDHLKEFENFYNKYVMESKKGSRIAYDFKNKSGNKSTITKKEEGATEVTTDYAIDEFLMEARKAADDNLTLSNLDNYLRDMSQEKVDEVLKAVSEFDTTADTDINKLFDIPRRTHQEWEQLQKEADAQDMQAAIQQLEYDTLFDSATGKEVRSMLIAYTDVDKETMSRANKAMLLVDDIKKFKEAGLLDFQNKLVKVLYTNESFQKLLKGKLEKQRFDKGLELSLRPHFSKALEEALNIKAFDEQEFQTILDSMISRTMRLANEDPEALRVLLPPEEVAQMEVDKTVTTAVAKQVEAKDTKGIPTESLEKAERVAQNKLKLDSLFRPVFLELRRELSRLQLQAMWDVTRYTELLSTMLENPFIAPEVLTGAATQTIYNFIGSKHNVEYMTKTCGAYVSDLRNRLKAQTAQTVSGKTLDDIYKDPEYKADLFESLVSIKHGIAGTKNADTDRVAQMILDQEASFLGSFLRMGSDYSNPINLIDRGKLRYIDTFITDTEVDEIHASIQKGLSFTDPATSTRLLQSDEVGKIKYGYDTIDKSEKRVIKAIKNAAEEGPKIFEDIFKIHNPIYKKIALWALRDLDLDKMFDPHHTSFLGLNTVRDALFTGNWEDVIQGDLANLRQALIDLKRIKSLILGTKLLETKVADETLYNVTPSAWVFKFHTGLTDTGAITKETKAASVNAYEGNLHFKSAAEELRAVNMFGYDTAPDYVHKSFSKMHQAYFCLERFGTRPIAMVQELISAFEGARKSGKSPSFEKAVKDYRSRRNESDAGVGAKLGFTQHQMDSVLNQVAQICGEQNNAPSSATRLVTSIVRLLSSPLLVGAGFKSFSDYGTIWSGLTMNALAEGRMEAVKLTAEASDVIRKNKDILDLVLATNMLESDTLLKKMLNDPAADLIATSKEATAADVLDRLSVRFADTMLNGLGRMTDITNRNKQVAGLAIEMAIGKNADMSYKSMPENLKTMLFRESITEMDWEFIRKHMIHDVMEYTRNKMQGMPTQHGFKGSSFKLLIPQSAMEISDDIIIEELKARRVKNYNKNTINNFRRDLLANAYNLVDTSAEEMCSIPSNRIGYILRGGRPKGSGWGTAAEIVTQYMSFGCSILMNTYGRFLANQLTGEVGITIMDLFNPNVKLLNHSRPEIFLGLFGHMMQITMTMMVVENAVKALQGNIQRPYDEEGFHLDNWLLSPALGSMGLLGTLLDAVFTGIEGSGQRGGGFSMQVAPSVSTALRQAYRVRQPIASTRILPEDKPKAVAAAIAQNVAGQFGLRSTPVIGPAYQLLIGDWLDMHAKGGYKNYASSLDARERRGQVVFDWTRDPKPIWDRLQD